MRTIWAQRVVFFPLIKCAWLLFDDSICILLESQFWGSLQMHTIWVSHLLKGDLLVIHIPCEYLKGSSTNEQVHLLGIHSRKDWKDVEKLLYLSRSYKDKVCPHFAKDHHFYLFTIFKVSNYHLTLLTNSQCVKLIIVIIQLKVKKLLTRNLHPVMYQSRTYFSQFFLSVCT